MTDSPLAQTHDGDPVPIPTGDGVEVSKLTTTADAADVVLETIEADVGDTENEIEVEVDTDTETGTTAANPAEDEDEDEDEAEDDLMNDAPAQPETEMADVTDSTATADSIATRESVAPFDLSADTAADLADQPSSVGSSPGTDSGPSAEPEAELTAAPNDESSGTIPAADTAVANQTATPTPSTDTFPPDRPAKTRAGFMVDDTDDESDRPAEVDQPVQLPNGILGILEDRVAQDPIGDVDAWLGLLAEHEASGPLTEAREMYERFLKQFPTAAQQWVAYVRLELSHDNFYQTEKLFERSILAVPDLRLWTAYLDYIRRQNNLAADSSGGPRNTVYQAFQFVLQNVGQDPDAGALWIDYIAFLQAGPGTVGGAGWQDQQKTDLVRGAFRRAVALPTDAVCRLWKDYDAFEVSLSRLRGRKMVQEVSAAYMTARTAQMTLAKLTGLLDRRTPARLPPAPGCRGHSDYMNQVGMWKSWIGWEMDDPLVLKDDDPAAFKARVVYAFRQALIPLRFCPHIWVDAAEFCYKHGLTEQADKFIDEGIAANPENCLLVFRKADRVEMAGGGDDIESRRKRGDDVQAPYDRLLDALYDLINRHKAREQSETTAAAARFGSDTAALEAFTAPLQAFYRRQVALISKVISFTWIALMRAMRRIQGHGVDRKQLGGFRKVFLAARRRGRLTSDVYIASALIEHNCFHDPAATVVFERGMKLFPDDGKIVLAYLEHLVAKHEIANARAEFEKAVARFTEKPDTVQKSLPLFKFMHHFETRYGELALAVDIERRMGELVPSGNPADLFARRYRDPEFDPTTASFIISPGAQTQPIEMESNIAVGPPTFPDASGFPSPPMQPSHDIRPAPMSMSIPGPPVGSGPAPPPNQTQVPTGPSVLPPLPPSVPRMPGSGQMGMPSAPKRMASELDDPTGSTSLSVPTDIPSMPPRKMARNDRGESPLKGAAGRRLATLRNAAAAAASATGISGSNSNGLPNPSNTFNGVGGTVGSSVSIGTTGDRSGSNPIGGHTTTINGSGTLNSSVNVSLSADPLPGQITFLLGILPNSGRFDGDQSGSAGWLPMIDPVRLTALISRLDLDSVDARMG